MKSEYKADEKSNIQTLPKNKRRTETTSCTPLVKKEN